MSVGGNRGTKWRAVAATVALTIGSGLAAVVAAPPAGATPPSAASVALAPGAKVADVLPGKTDQAAASVAVTISNTFSTGDQIQIPIETGSTPTANTGTVAQAVSFSTTPTVTVTAGSSNSASDTTPSFTYQTNTNSSDSAAVTAAGLKDELTIYFDNSASSSTPNDTFTFTISGIDYTVGTDAGIGTAIDPIDLAPSYVAADSLPSQPFSGSPVENAEIVSFAASDTPTGVPTGSTSYPVAPFAVTEQGPGRLVAGEYLLSAAAASSSSSPLPLPGTSSSSAGVFTGEATVSATGLTISVLPASGTCPTSGGVSQATAAVNSSGEVPICVVTPSSGAPGSLTFSSLTYTPPSATGPFDVAFANSGGTISFTTAQPAVTVLDNPRIAGVSADDTAAAAAESLYASPMNSGQGGAAVLASDAEYQDALSASFLGNAPLTYQTIAGSSAKTSSATMTTPVPILLNPPTPPSGGESQTAAVGAIEKLGVSTLYIVGGTDAISSSVQTELEAVQVGSSGGTPQDLQVIRVAGVTAEETAADVAETPKLSGSEGTLPATPGAYGIYSSGASGSTSGPSSGSVPTAILVDGDEFQDALAASPLAYSDTLPVLLTAGGQSLDPNASAAISQLGIKQVIVVGGSAAVSDQDVSTLQSDGLAVLRIAGETFDQTAAELASFELNDYSAPSPSQSPLVEGLDSAATEDGGPGLTVGTSRGDAYQDALSSAQVLGKTAGDISPLLLTGGVFTLPSGTAGLLGADGTAPAGGLTVYTNASGSSTTEHILDDVVFGGTLAQSPSLVQAELNAVAAG